jgi:hypothetical protein
MNYRKITQGKKACITIYFVTTCETV